MTKDEIKTLIAEKISGQGNQVDIGGVLADILNELVDASGSVEIVTSISAQSTDEQVPSAKCVYTVVGNIESLLAAI